MGLGTRKHWEADRDRYAAELEKLLAGGFSDEHALVRRARRRLEAVNRALTDPRLAGLIDEEKQDGNPAGS
jgi:hypothetical protein